jgi:hypothetical protein
MRRLSPAARKAFELFELATMGVFLIKMLQLVYFVAERGAQAACPAGIERVYLCIQG